MRSIDRLLRQSATNTGAASIGRDERPHDEPALLHGPLGSQARDLGGRLGGCRRQPDMAQRRAVLVGDPGAEIILVTGQPADRVTRPYAGIPVDVMYPPENHAEPWQTLPARAR